MTTETQLTVPLDTIPDALIISTLTRSHGSVDLAAERLNTTPDLLSQRLPNLPYTLLLDSIRAARLLRAFDSWVVMKDVAIATLPELSPHERAKLLIQFMDRFESMLTPPPPVHGAESQQPQNNFQINLLNNMQSEADNAKDLLQRRLAQMDHQDGNDNNHNHNNQTPSIIEGTAYGASPQ